MDGKNEFSWLLSCISFCDSYIILILADFSKLLMQRETALIIKKYVQGNPHYDICKDGLQILRRYLTKKVLNI
jgi:hypothetical protein